MLTLEEIVKRLETRNMSKIARDIGVTGAYLSAIKNGKKINPSYETIKKLSEALSDEKNN